MADGSVASVTHIDSLRRGDGGWRVSRRAILAQRTPLGGLPLTHPGEPIVLQPKALPHLDAVVVNHEHYDHCDLHAAGFGALDRRHDGRHALPQE